MSLMNNDEDIDYIRNDYEYNYPLDTPDYYANSIITLPDDDINNNVKKKRNDEFQLQRYSLYETNE